MKEFEKALEARSKNIAKQLNDLDKSQRKINDEDKRSNRIGAGNGEGGNSMRLRGGGGGEELSGRIGTRPDAHANREQHGNGNSARIAGNSNSTRVAGNSNSTRISGGGKVGGKKLHVSGKQSHGGGVGGRAGNGNDEKDDSIRLKTPVDSDALLSSSAEWGHSGKTGGGLPTGTGTGSTTAVHGTTTDDRDNRRKLRGSGNTTPTTATGSGHGGSGHGGGGGGGSGGRVTADDSKSVLGSHEGFISVDTTLGMLVELDSMKNRLQGQRGAHSGAGVGAGAGAGVGVLRVDTPSELDDMMPDMSLTTVQPSPHPVNLGDHKGGSGSGTVEAIPHSPSTPTTNIFGYPVSSGGTSNHVR